MTDQDQASTPKQRRFASLIDKLGISGAESFGKNAFISFLAMLVVVAWLISIFLHIDTDETLTNVVMIIIGYFYGSSAGSKRKEDAAIIQQAVDQEEKKL